jgi:hypothetical protein
MIDMFHCLNKKCEIITIDSNLLNLLTYL